MLRTDGCYKIYRIQHKQEDGKWVYSSFDHFGYPGDWRSKEGFSACGNCWQETGVEGTYNRELAIKGAKELAAKHKMNFRVVWVVLSQQTIVVE